MEMKIVERMKVKGEERKEIALIEPRIHTDGITKKPFTGG